MSKNTAIVIKRIFLFAMLFYYYIIIASFSAQTATVSSSSSEGVTALIYDTVVSLLDKNGSIGKKYFVEAAEHIVRKCAHFGNFTLYSLFVSAYVVSFKEKTLKLAAVAFSVCVQSAVFDEVHQLFVQGRSCQLSDMLIDSSGAMLGILIFFVCREYMTGRNKL